jgi:quinoprotein glucose dehydrogenase
MKKTYFLMICVSVASTLFFGALGAEALAKAAQGSRTTNDGVFTADQAKRGDAVYKEQCATCHGDNLEGSGPMPPLAGKDFLANWTGKTVAELFEKTHGTMPATAPGTLTPAQAADLTAHMLSASGFPAGTTELEGKPEALLQIKIEAPKAAAAVGGQ